MKRIDWFWNAVWCIGLLIGYLWVHSIYDVILTFLLLCIFDYFLG